jgi:putative IMPACT (imprinted ancient) family translation regulator
MFYTIEKDVTAELVEKKSKFISNIFYVENQEEAENKIKEIKRKYYDAKHNCFAYVTVNEDGNKIERCSDDGEPSRYCWIANIGVN